MFLSTPQNPSDLALLLDLNVGAIKIGSDDFTNTPLIAHYAATGLPLILSCGMADMGEVERTLSVARGTQCALLVCTSSYPTPPADVNIARVTTLAAAFPDVVIGFSDHTEGSDAAVMAVALGASIFEKHFTLDHDLAGPDHWFSATPAEARRWIDAVRTASVMRGHGVVQPSADELMMRKQARRSVTALQNISAGDLLDAANIGLRRPYDGLPPSRLADVIGRRARRAIAKGEKLSDADFE
jgi:sialic acid synthase SpsE